VTPRRLDPDGVTAKLQLMREALRVLDTVGDVTGEQLRSDAILRGAVERYLTLLVDQAVAINLHVAAATGQPVVRDYTASFPAAADAGALPRALAESLAASAGMRNVIIHAYVTVDLDRVAAALPIARRDYARFISAISDFIAARDRPAGEG
jgi:uncharacterized protein YutE (UPF0331/DUF86 family)